MHSILLSCALFSLITPNLGVPLRYPINDKSVPRYLLRLYQEISDGLKAGKCGYNTVQNIKDHGGPISCQEYQLQFNLSAISFDDDNNLEAARIHLELNEHLASSLILTNSNYRLYLGHGTEKGDHLLCESVPRAGVQDVVFNVTEVVLSTKQIKTEFLNLTLIIESETQTSTCLANPINFDAMLELETSSLNQQSCESEEDTNTKRRKRHVSNKSSRLLSNSNGNCKRHPYSVNFKDIGWDSWIIAPSSYDAYFCAGVCGFPLGDHFNATSHAILQSLIHSYQPSLIPSACCAPTKLSSTSILYSDPNGAVILKVYENMVVEECGCL